MAFQIDDGNIIIRLEGGGNSVSVTDEGIPIVEAVRELEFGASLTATDAGNGTAVIDAVTASVTASPVGADTELQINNDGQFGAASGVTHPSPNTIDLQRIQVDEIGLQDFSFHVFDGGAEFNGDVDIQGFGSDLTVARDLTVDRITTQNAERRILNEVQTSQVLTPSSGATYDADGGSSDITLSLPTAARGLVVRIHNSGETNNVIVDGDGPTINNGLSVTLAPSEFGAWIYNESRLNWLQIA